MDLPTYESSAENTLLLGSDGAPPPALLNLVPFQGEVSFQRGYLGYTSSTIQGSLQIKFTSSDPAVYRAHVDKVTVVFAGVESIKSDDNDDAAAAAGMDDEGASHQHAHGRQKQQQRGKGHVQGTTQPLDLIRDCKTLWDRTTAAAASRDGSSSLATPSTSGPPGNLDISFQLTDDLPHCCHIGKGSIEYTLTATLHSSSRPDLSIQSVIHINRTSPPPPSGDAQSIQPEIYTSQHPTELSVFFPHGISNFRRSEAIELRVRVPPPDASLVEEKGLKLKSISAELVRTISISENEGEEPEITELLERPSVKTVISRSGKSAAFSSSRSVFLHIWLQPVDPDSCESITQTTIYNEISFSLRVTASFRGKQGDRQDITFFEKPVTVIPDYPPSSIESLDTAISADSSNLSRMYTPQFSATSTSTNANPRQLDPNLLRIFQNETEFDGYEQVSEGVDFETAPPNIDADRPPPSIEEESSSDGHEVLPSSSVPQPVQGVVPASPLTASDLTDEAPPYSSAAGLSPNNALSSSTGQASRTDTDASPLPPPPYERQGGQEQQNAGEETRLQQLREAMAGIMRA
ncbi:hypothetical protein P389DRAFT_12286 [Cystobasidium minutum MCA 4210]|uniref:uncharacterized protein n=1 Tax=Cystobasidium minutum MCA 4210 TaxID=1397322 RepID=UPI0034CD539E|eukprot:jgi/Rhomi1/12286/CE12285_531